ncbi:amino-acid N-acetyltransferase [Kribbia dieselivorans]|uniref:amino-acid N-acetyltransferase n=1 Tax=Kribbia dieselivorans TaxID=331526 RepID=UPI0009FAA045|nr:amino-acid N-acetyltransferase [Kribbia dieselivorans]
MPENASDSTSETTSATTPDTAATRAIAGGQSQIIVRAATTRDVTAIRELVRPYAAERVLISKDAVAYYESIQEFRIAELDGRVVGCGALHVMWEDVAEIRTLATDPTVIGHGIGGRVLEALIDDARAIGVSRVFCLTFETSFFGKHGFVPIEGQAVSPEVYTELLHSYDEGVAEFLDLDRVKPNTLGNTRMLLTL